MQLGISGIRQLCALDDVLERLLMAHVARMNTGNAVIKQTKLLPSGNTVFGRRINADPVADSMDTVRRNS
jgi:hypothetical protein